MNGIALTYHIIIEELTDGDKVEQPKLVGSSLGGFYANMLSDDKISEVGIRLFTELNKKECMQAAYASYLGRMGEVRLPPMDLDYSSEIKNYPTWVAECDDKIVGGITMMFEDDYASIANIAVHPEFQGQGLGKMLTDGVNLVRLGNIIKPQPLKGWGYTYYEVAGSPHAMSTMMGVPPGTQQIKEFLWLLRQGWATQLFSTVVYTHRIDLLLHLFHDQTHGIIDALVALLQGVNNDLAKSVVVKQIDSYLDSIHGSARMDDQTKTNASCHDCHDAHNIGTIGSEQLAEHQIFGETSIKKSRDGIVGWVRILTQYTNNLIHMTHLLFLILKKAKAVFNILLIAGFSLLFLVFGTVHAEPAKIDKTVEQALEAKPDLDNGKKLYHNFLWINSFMMQHLEELPEQVSELIRKGANIDAPAKYGKRPLMFAAESGDTDIVAVLLSFGAEVNARTKSGSTALTFAVENGHAQISGLLIELGANVHDRTRTGFNPLMIAAKRGDAVIVAQLLAFGADVRSSDRKGNSALMHAIKAGHTEVVKTLFKYSNQVAPSVPNNAGLTPLMVAIDKEQNKSIEILLGKITNINFQDNFGAAALHYAAARNNLDVVKYLVVNGANINLQDEDGSTPLIAAVKAGHAETVSYLLASGADITIKDTSDKTAQLIAKEEKKQAILDLFTSKPPQ
ncbi:Ankyrin [Nymphon striatum]|nr:Ankyrin [Nymphon striatum]